MISEIRKEVRFAMRGGRFIILLSSFMFFALLTPVMLKVVLPYVLSSQLAGETSQDISNIINMTQIGSIQSYMGDIFEIGTIIVAFTLCGMLASDIRDSTLVLPLCSGKRFGWIVGAKMLVFGVLLVLIPITTLLANYLYSGFLFGFEVRIRPILFSGLLHGIYMLFLLACLLMWGAILKKPIATGFSTLLTGFGLHFAASLFDISKWTPSGLLIEAQNLTNEIKSPLLISLTVTTILIGAMIIITMFRLKRNEWNTRAS